MYSVSSNEQLVLLLLCKRSLNATAAQLARLTGLSSMGVGKILSSLESRGIVASEMIGRSKRFRIRYENAFVRRFLSFLLHKEAEESESRIKRWVVDLRRLEAKASIGVVFGSVLEREPHDIDVLLVTEQETVSDLRTAIDDLGTLAPHPIHSVLQTRADLERNAATDPVVENAVRGIVLFGYEDFVEVMGHVTSEKYGRVVYRES